MKQGEFSVSCLYDTSGGNMLMSLRHRGVNMIPPSWCHYTIRGVNVIAPLVVLISGVYVTSPFVVSLCLSF